MSSDPLPTVRRALLLVGLGAAVGLIDAPELASDAWRHGGGAWLCIWGLAVAGVGAPLLALEAGLARATGRPLPGALRARAGGAGEMVGWWCLSIAGGLAVVVLARAGWAMAPALSGAAQTPGVIAAIFGLSLLGAAARSARALPRLAAGAAALMSLMAVVAVVAAARRTAGASGLVALLTPRPAALAAGESWATVTGAAMLASAAGLGLISVGAIRLPDRARAGGQGLGVAVGGAALALLGAAATLAAWFSAGVLPPESDSTLANFAALPQAVAAAPLALRALPALAMGVGAVALATVVGAAWADALVDKWALRPGATRTGVGLALAAAGAALAWAGLSDPLGPSAGGATAALLERWLVGWGLPLAGLGLCLAARRVGDLPALFLAMDRQGGPRLATWVPTALRGPVPAVLLVSLGLATRAAVARFPGEDLPMARLGGLPGPLVGALAIAVPAGLLVGLTALATGLSWLEADPSAERSP